MRLLLASLACALFATACSDTCQELGNRLCDCTPVGTTKAACERNVQTEVSRLNPGADARAICAQKLETCNLPQGIQGLDFCDWVDGRCGKAACGMSEENFANLSGTNADGTPITPDPNDPSKPLCPK
jgi:hypothetical protein